MSESVVATRPKQKHPLESIGYGASFAPELETGETLATIVSVTVAGPDSALAVGSGSINGVTIFDDDGNPIGPGLAALFQVSAGTDGTDYRITVVATTNLANTRAVVCVLQVRSGQTSF